MVSYKRVLTVENSNCATGQYPLREKWNIMAVFRLPFVAVHKNEMNVVQILKVLS